MLVKEELYKMLLEDGIQVQGLLDNDEALRQYLESFLSGRALINDIIFTHDDFLEITFLESIFVLSVPLLILWALYSYFVPLKRKQRCMRKRLAHQAG